MRASRILFTGLLLLGPALAAPASSPRQSAAGSDGVDAPAYGVGFFIGGGVREELDRDGVGVDLELVATAFRDAVSGRQPMVARAELEAIMAAVHREMEQRMVRRLLEESPEFRELYERNLRRSRAFHELFGRQPGVVTLPSGTQYLILREGMGPSPRAGDTVLVSYRVERLDGSVLDERVAAEMRVEGLTDGAAEILSLMKAGSKWQAALPPQLAYGEAGRYPAVGPNESLVGVVELLAVRSGR
jgi:FKBP-type peptidyl-prolyl cis-trans isomerase